MQNLDELYQKQRDEEVRQELGRCYLNLLGFHHWSLHPLVILSVDPSFYRSPVQIFAYPSIHSPAQPSTTIQPSNHHTNNLFEHPSIPETIYLSVRPSISPPTRPPIRLSIHSLESHISIHPSIHLTVRPWIFLNLLSVYSFTHPFIHPIIHPSYVEETETFLLGLDSLMQTRVEGWENSEATMYARDRISRVYTVAWEFSQPLRVFWSGYIFFLNFPHCCFQFACGKLAYPEKPWLRWWLFGIVFWSNVLRGVPEGTEGLQPPVGELLSLCREKIDNSSGNFLWW